MSKPQLTLRGLEIFIQVSRSGSVRKVATDTGLSISTVSHHLRNVEENLGVTLMDHTRRPMLLTPAGSIFARHVEEGLRMIRRGEAELKSGSLAHVRELRLGIVDDFDSEVAPELAKFLARAMPRCAFKHHTRPSHDILSMLYDQKLDVGVATRPVTDVPDLSEYPLLRDPFVVALPADTEFSPEDVLTDKTPLPFLRYSQTLFIGTLIGAHLRRCRISLANRFELESNQSIMSLIAEGSGWTITTPSSYARAKRFHDQIKLHPFPGKGFARTLSLFCTDDYPAQMAALISGSLSQLIQRHLIGPITQRYPWLSHEFTLLDGAPQTPEYQTPGYL